MDLTLANSCNGVDVADDGDVAHDGDGEAADHDVDDADESDIQCRGVLCKSMRTSAPPIHHKAVTNKPSHTPHFCHAQKKIQL